MMSLSLLAGRTVVFFIAWVFSVSRLQERLKQKRLEKEEQEKKEQIAREKQRRAHGKDMTSTKEK